MRTKLFLIPIVFSTLMFWAADNIVPLNAKVGLWEMTVTHSLTGMPAAPSIPPETLAKMPPDQRAKIQAMMSGGPTTDVNKECVTKEKLAMNSAFSTNHGECTRTVVSSTGAKLNVKFHCQEKQSSSDGTLLIEAIGSDNVKGSMHMAMNSKGQNMNMDFTISGKYLGSDCGDVK